MCDERYVDDRPSGDQSSSHREIVLTRRGLSSMSVDKNDAFRTAPSRRAKYVSWSHPDLGGTANRE